MWSEAKPKNQSEGGRTGEGRGEGGVKILKFYFTRQKTTNHLDTI